MDSFWFLGKTFLGCQTGKKLGDGLHPDGQGKTLYLQFFISKCSIKRESGFYSQEEIHLKFSQAKGKTGLCGWKIIIIMDIFLLYFCYKLFLLKCNQWPKKTKNKKKTYPLHFFELTKMFCWAKQSSLSLMCLFLQRILPCKVGKFNSSHWRASFKAPTRQNLRMLISSTFDFLIPQEENVRLLDGSEVDNDH